MGVDRKVSGAKKVVWFQGIFLNPYLINQCIFYAINSAFKTRECAPRIKLKTRVELMCSGRVGGYSTIRDIPSFSIQIDWWFYLQVLYSLILFCALSWLRVELKMIPQCLSIKMINHYIVMSC